MALRLALELGGLNPQDFINLLARYHTTDRPDSPSSNSDSSGVSSLPSSSSIRSPRRRAIPRSRNTAASIAISVASARGRSSSVSLSNETLGTGIGSASSDSSSSGSLADSARSVPFSSFSRSSSFSSRMMSFSSLSDTSRPLSTSPESVSADTLCESIRAIKTEEVSSPSVESVATWSPFPPFTTLDSTSSPPENGDNMQKVMPTPKNTRTPGRRQTVASRLASSLSPDAADKSPERINGKKDANVNEEFQFVQPAIIPKKRVMDPIGTGRPNQKPKPTVNVGHHENCILRHRVRNTLPPPPAPPAERDLLDIWGNMQGNVKEWWMGYNTYNPLVAGNDKGAENPPTNFSQTVAEPAQQYIIRICPICKFEEPVLVSRPTQQFYGEEEQSKDEI